MSLMSAPQLSAGVTKMFPDAQAFVNQNKCPLCQRSISAQSFRDELSRKEYSISGLCQACQDKTFGASDDCVY
jgi:hypothetical protein